MKYSKKSGVSNPCKQLIPGTSMIRVTRVVTRIFKDTDDRLNFLEILSQSVDNYQVILHAYVLMVNHYHFLVETPLGNLSEFMRHLNITYTSYFNRFHKRAGHLFQGRYKSVLIDKEPYLATVSKYIHLNPVKTKDFKSKTQKE